MKYCCVNCVQGEGSRIPNLIYCKHHGIGTSAEKTCDFFSQKEEAKRKHKYNAKPVIIDGIKFASTKEGKRYSELNLLRKSGEVNFFFMQTPIQLPGNVRYFLDFLIFWKDGSYTFEDVKGRDTPTSKVKRKIVEDIYNIKIEEV